MSRWLCAWSICCGLLYGCADRPADLQEIYIVRSQDTLYSIAWRHGVDYRDLARWNGIGPGYRISVGQALRLAPSTREARASRPPQAPPPAVVSQLQWMWPTDRRGAPVPVSGGGILIRGQLGQDVRAASAGHVVYAGTGIRGYGNLIILKHGEYYLSAYAHNSEMLVHEGQEISFGQLIGKMGEGSPQKPALYFEIRLNGKPVDPLQYLPR